MRSVGKRDCHFAIYCGPSFQAGQEYLSDIIFSHLRTAKRVSNTNAKHALGQCFPNPRPRTGTRPRNYKIYTGGDTTRCDWSILFI